MHGVRLMKYLTHHIKSTHRIAQIARDACFFSLVFECNIAVAEWGSHVRSRNNYTDAIMKKKITAMEWPFLVEWHTITVIYHYRGKMKIAEYYMSYSAAALTWASSGCTPKQLTAICDHFSEHSICHHKNWSDFISLFIFWSLFAKVHIEYQWTKDATSARTFFFRLKKKRTRKDASEELMVAGSRHF